jgi:apolipoprotein D and lipocalin family protein
VAVVYGRMRERDAGLGLVLLLAALALGCGSSGPPLDVAKNVDLSRFQGKWYEIARLPRATQANCFGTTAFYTQASDGSLSFINQCNLASATGSLYTVSMTATVPNASVPAKLALQVGGFSGDYWILEVGPSYEYAVVGHPSRAYWWLLSRTPSLDADTTQGVLDRAKADQFDTSQVLYTPQPPEGERDTLSGPEGPIPAGPTMGCSMARLGQEGDDGPVWLLGALIAAAVSVRTRRRALRHLTTSAEGSD